MSRATISVLVILLIKEISGKVEKTNLVLLGTYRTEEVDKDHSLTKIKDDAKKKKFAIKNINISKFKKERLNKLVAGVLGERAEKAVESCEKKKEEGRAFFCTKRFVCKCIFNCR